MRRHNVSWGEEGEEREGRMVNCSLDILYAHMGNVVHVLSSHLSSSSFEDSIIR